MLCICILKSNDFKNISNFQNGLKITYSSKQWAAVNTSLSVMTDPPHTWAPFSVNITFESKEELFHFWCASLTRIENPHRPHRHQLSSFLIPGLKSGVLSYNHALFHSWFWIEILKNVGDVDAKLVTPPLLSILTIHGRDPVRASSPPTTRSKWSLWCWMGFLTGWPHEL